MSAANVKPMSILAEIINDPIFGHRYFWNNTFFMLNCGFSCQCLIVLGSLIFFSFFFFCFVLQKLWPKKWWFVRSVRAINFILLIFFLFLRVGKRNILYFVESISLTLLSSIFSSFFANFLRYTFFNYFFHEFWFGKHVSWNRSRMIFFQRFLFSFCQFTKCWNVNTHIYTYMYVQGQF